MQRRHPQALLRGEQHGQGLRSLSIEQARRLEHSARAGATIAELAARFDVDSGTMARALGRAPPPAELPPAPPEPAPSAPRRDPLLIGPRGDFGIARRAAVYDATLTRRRGAEVPCPAPLGGRSLAHPSA